MDRLKMCTVRGCLSKTDGERQFFWFPRSKAIQQQWVNFCEDKSLTELKGLTKRWVCDLHFKQEDFSPSHPFPQRLKRMAVPSCTGPPVIAAGKPTSLEVLPAGTTESCVSSALSQSLSSTVIPCTLSPVPSNSDSVTSTSFPKFKKRLPFSTPTTDQILAEPSSHAWMHFEHSYASKGKFSDCLPEGINSSSLSPSASLTLQDICMTRVSQLSTPRKHYLYKYAKKKENEFRKLNKKYKKMKVHLDKLCKPENSVATAFDSLSKHMSSAFVIFLSSELKSLNKKPRGRRWTVKEKMLALSLYKRSPKAYTLMSNVFALPSKRTLKRLVNKLPFTTGVNTQMFATLNQQVEQLKKYERVCTLIFDEISIREHLKYNCSTDRIDGFEDFGHKGRTGRIANHALVFMIRGLFRRWKQPVAYYFSHSSVRSEILAELILVILDACSDAGLYIVGTVCDMGATNVKALKIIGSTPENPFFLYQNRSVFTIFDPPHLLKCTRNLLQKYNVKCHVKTESLDFVGEARWDDIRKAFEWDRNNSIFRFLHHLRNDHLQPVGKQKMKVSLAAQVLSYSVAMCINSAVSVNVLDQSAIATAVFINQCDRLFDSLNGYPYNVKGKTLREQVNSNSPHMAFWQEALQFVKSWHFQKAGHSFVPPSQTGWLTTINAVMQLWTYVQSQFEDVKCLSVRCLNQDPLENLFGSVRAHCGANHNPTVTQFVDALKTCIINGLAFRELRNTNCVEDEASFLSDLQTFLGLDIISNEDNTSNGKTADTVHITCDEEPDIPSDMNCMSTAYVSGFIARKLLANNTCDNCRAGLCTEQSCELFNIGIEFKEYTDGKQRLTYPTEKLVICVAQCANLVDEMLDEKAHQDRLAEVVMCAIKQRISFKWLMDCCIVHYDQNSNNFIKYICKICIPWWCKRKNSYLVDLSRRRQCK